MMLPEPAGHILKATGSFSFRSLLTSLSEPLGKLALHGKLRRGFGLAKMQAHRVQPTIPPAVNQLWLGWASFKNSGAALLSMLISSMGGKFLRSVFLALVLCLLSSAALLLASSRRFVQAFFVALALSTAPVGSRRFLGVVGL